MSIQVLANKRQARRIKRWDKQYNVKSRVYVFPEGETILENLFGGRQNRPYKMYRELLKDFVPMQGARWSRTAGCGCGCSPGFILERPFRDADGMPVDFFVTVGDPADKKPEPVAEASYLDLVAA